MKGNQVNLQHFLQRKVADRAGGRALGKGNSLGSQVSAFSSPAHYLLPKQVGVVQGVVL